MSRAFGAIAISLAIAGVASPARAAIVEEVAQPSRIGGSAAALADGRVLLTGGIATGALSSTAEIFDPTTRTWAPTSAMSERRSGHTMVTLPSGLVLVSGGFTAESTYLSSTELYDPAARSWSTAAATSRGHVDHAVLLSDGRAALVIETPTGSGSTFEVFNAATKAWSALEPPKVEHLQSALAPLAAGGALLVSGVGLERYAPGAGWSKSTVAPYSWQRPFARTLKDGRVLIVGGGTSALSGGPKLYSPDTDTIRSLAGQNRLDGATAIQLTDGGVLILGLAAASAGTPATIELFDPKTLVVTSLATQPPGLNNYAAVPLLDGSALLVDGTNRKAFVITPPRVCTTGTDCTSGHCVDGFCCDSACSGQCEACDVAGQIGTCVGVSGRPHGSRAECSPAHTPACRATSCDPARSRTACVAPVFRPPCDCAVDADCPTGFCADGVCCNTKCDGQCEACDLPDARGVCVPVVGEPRGVRKGCAVPSRGICSIQACDGVDPSACKFVKGAETSCDSICGGRVQRHCDSNGLCGRPEELRCPDDNCSIHAVEPARPRLVDAAWVLILAASIHRARRRR